MEFENQETKHNEEKVQAIFKLFENKFINLANNYTRCLQPITEFVETKLPEKYNYKDLFYLNTDLNFHIYLAKNCDYLLLETKSDEDFEDQRPGHRVFMDKETALKLANTILDAYKDDNN
jgi:hypothetical protein